MIPLSFVWAEIPLKLNFKETTPEMITALKEWQFGEPGIFLAIDFEPGSFAIQKSSFPLLNELGKALRHRSLKNRRFIIRGHTDSDGKDEDNVSLSIKRAFSVKIYLGQFFSIPGSNISVTGMGEKQPLVANTSLFNKRLNRRIEIIPDILPPPKETKNEYSQHNSQIPTTQKDISFTPIVSKTNLSEKQLRHCFAQKDYYVKKWPWNTDLSHEKGQFRNFFKTAHNKTITDLKTRLMWQTDGSENPVNWNVAQQYIHDLNQKQFANYSDWRIPTAEELLSLIENRINLKGLYINSAFSEKQRTCWTINTNNNRLWVVFFNYGNIYYSLPENENHIRAVRSIK